MKFLALEHHLKLHPRLVVSKNPLAASGQNIVVASKGYSLSCLVNSTHLFDKIHIWRNKRSSIFLFFLILPFSRYSSCSTNFPARQIGHLYKSTFFSPQSFFYCKCKGNTNNPITNQGAMFTHNGIIAQQSDFVFCLHFNWRAYIHAPEWYRHFANPQWIMK